MTNNITIIATSILLLCIWLAPANTHALSIAFDGYSCDEPENFQNTKPDKNKPHRSGFTVTSDEGNGFYNLILFGGLPRFFDYSESICIENELSIGYYKDAPTIEDLENATPENRWLPEKINTVPATGYFNGKELIVMSSSAYSDQNGGVSTNGENVNTSTTAFNYYTLIFDYNPESSSFVLRNMVFNSGGFIAVAVSSFPESYAETLQPFRTRVIKTPPVKIEYFLE